MSLKVKKEKSKRSRPKLSDFSKVTTWIKVWDWETWGLYLDSWTYLDLAPNLNDTYPLISHLIEYLGHPKSLSPPNDDDCYQQQKTRKSKVAVLPKSITYLG